MKLGDVMTLSKGNVISIEDDKDYVIAGVQNYGAGILNKRKVKGFELNMKKYQLIKPNQLMWCKVDTKNGAFGITKLEHTNSLASTNMALADIDTSKCHPEFIEYLFRISFFHEIITKASSGTTNRKYLTPTQLFENIEIPDFNKDEQLHWLEKVDSIINSGLSKELNHQLTLVKKLRQQLLQDAVQGKLLAKANDSIEFMVPPDKSGGNSKHQLPLASASGLKEKYAIGFSQIKTGQQLLEKIKAEKEKLIAEKKLKKEKELPPIKLEEIPFEIPENWVWCRLGEIANNIEYGTSQKAEMSSEHIPVLRMNNIQDGKIDYDKLKYVQSSIDDLPKLYLKKGDLLFNRTNSYELVGKSGVYHGAENVMTFASYLIRVQFSKNISTDFINHYINSSSCRKTQLEPEIIQQNGQANFNGTKLKNIICPFPPLAEQNRIVQKLDELMAYCNDLEASIKESQAQNEKLLQQVLREALRPVEHNQKQNKKEVGV